MEQNINKNVTTNESKIHILTLDSNKKKQDKKKIDLNNGIHLRKNYWITTKFYTENTDEEIKLFFNVLKRDFGESNVIVIKDKYVFDEHGVIDKSLIFEVRVGEHIREVKNILTLIDNLIENFRVHYMPNIEIVKKIQEFKLTLEFSNLNYLRETAKKNDNNHFGIIVLSDKVKQNSRNRRNRNDDIVWGHYILLNPAVEEKYTRSNINTLDSIMDKNDNHTRIKFLDSMEETIEMTFPFVNNLNIIFYESSKEKEYDGKRFWNLKYNISSIIVFRKDHKTEQILEKFSNIVSNISILSLKNLVEQLKINYIRKKFVENKCDSFQIEFDSIDNYLKSMLPFQSLLNQLQKINKDLKEKNIENKKSTIKNGYKKNKKRTHNNKPEAETYTPFKDL